MEAGKESSTSSLSSSVTSPLSRSVCDDAEWVRGRDYRRGSRLGKGGFGVVYECINLVPRQTHGTGKVFLKRGALFAEKVVDMPNMNDASRVEDLRHEIEVLSNLCHPHIVRYYGSAVSGKKRNRFHLFMECVPGGSLKDVVDKFGLLSESVVQVYSEQILQALDYLHSNGYIHRDLKASNILVTTSSTVKVTDFGTCHKMSQCYGRDVTSPSPSPCPSSPLSMNVEERHPGTPFFFPPERVLQGRIGYQTDIWALGCVVLEMVSGRVPFSSGSNYMQVYYRVGNGEKPRIPGGCSEPLKAFLGECFADAEIRPSAAELLQSRFIKEELAYTSDCSEVDSEEEEAAHMEASSFATIVTSQQTFATTTSAPTASYVTTAMPPTAGDAFNSEASLTSFTSAASAGCTPSNDTPGPSEETAASSYFDSSYWKNLPTRLSSVRLFGETNVEESADVSPKPSASEWGTLATVVLYSSTAAHGAHFAFFLLRKQRYSWFVALFGDGCRRRYPEYDVEASAASARHAREKNAWVVWLWGGMRDFFSNSSNALRVEKEAGRVDPQAVLSQEEAMLDVVDSTEHPVAHLLQHPLRHLRQLRALPLTIFNWVWDTVASAAFLRFLTVFGAMALIFKSIGCLCLIFRFRRHAQSAKKLGLSPIESSAHIREGIIADMNHRERRRRAAVKACEKFVGGLMYVFLKKSFLL